MPVQFVPFTTFSPDQEFGGDLLRCENVIPALGGLRSMPQAEDNALLTGQKLLSTYLHYYPSGASYLGDDATEFHASRTRVYEYSAGVFTNLTGALVFGSAASSTRAWASFGNDVIGVNYTDAPIRRVNNAGNFVALGASTFIPNGRCVGVVREFMIHAALSNAGRFQDEFAWSDANDATWYDDKTAAARPASLAGSKRIVSAPGQIMAFSGGEYGIFFKRGSMHALQFTGGNDIWRLDQISPGVGTPLPRSVVRCRDGGLRFWGGNGFYVQSGLSEPAIIPSSAGVTALLLDSNSLLGNSLSHFYADREEEDTAMFGVEDPELSGVFWFYRGDNDDGNGNNWWVFHNYQQDTWALGRVTSVGFTSAGANRNFISQDGGVPRLTYGSRSNGTNSWRWRFNEVIGYYGITLATQRFSLAKEGSHGQGQRVRINAIQPVIMSTQDSYSPDYKLDAIPSGTTFRLVASNEPNFQEQLDADGGQVSPRSVSQDMTFANGYGWLGMNGIEGRSFLLEMTLAESTTLLRGFRGCWIDYTEV